jgi:mRNA interferase RelE/StbE
MDSYEIRLKSSAERDLRNIDRQYIPRIINTIESLAVDPFSSQTRKIRGSERIYRIRVGDYRVVYEIDTKTKIVTIFHILHRKEAYR